MDRSMVSLYCSRIVWIYAGFSCESTEEARGFPATVSSRRRHAAPIEPWDMPNIEQHGRMDELDDAFALAIEADALASLALVSTGDCRREWTYNAGSREYVMSRLNRGLSGHPRFPIEILVNREPDWATFNDFQKRIAA